MTVLYRIICGMVLVVAVSACAGSQVRPEAPAEGTQPDSYVETIQMSPFYFEGGPDGLDIYTDTDLFRRAGNAYDLQEWTRAYNIYQKLIEKFPDSDYRILAHYNAGLCLLQLDEAERALRFFLATRELTPERAALMRDVLEQIGQLHEDEEDWHAARPVFETLAARDDTSEERRYQYLARAHIAAAFAEDADEDIRRLEDFVREYRHHIRANPTLDNHWLARAQMAMGDVHLARFRAIELQLPQERLEADLEAKAGALLRAQSYYMRTLQINNPPIASAAVYRIGLAYEEFYHALNHAPLPPELDATEREVYREELRAVTEPVREKAILAYDRIIQFSNRLTLRTEWVDKARDRIVELRTAGRFLESDETPAQE